MGLYVDTSGHGPPLLLLHGWAMHSGVFSALTERLREANTLYLVDFPGHGRSRNRAWTQHSSATLVLFGVAMPTSWHHLSSADRAVIMLARQENQSHPAHRLRLPR